MPMNDFRKIPFAQNYAINRFGIVKRLTKSKGTWPGKILRTTTHHFGYPRVSLCINGKNKKYELHLVMAITFIGKKPFPKAEVAHIDGNPNNNNISNLRWCSHKDNERDKIRHGTSPKGENNGAAKLTVEEVRSIRSSRGTHEEIGRAFGISFQNVSKIKNRQRWAHVD